MKDTTEITLMDEIKQLWSELKGKKDFIIKAAADEQISKSPMTLRVHWFGAYWQIPVEYRQRIKDLLEESIGSNGKNKQA